MKRFLLVVGMTVLLVSPLSADISLTFSTASSATSSWNLNYVSGAWELSFAAQTTVVDSSNPADSVLLGDFVQLPTIRLSNLVDLYPLTGMPAISAQLTPVSPGNMLISTDESGHAVNFTAALASGGSLTLGTSYLAYSSPADDLDVVWYTPGYSSVLSQIAAADASFPVDLSFAGPSTSNLYVLLKGTSGSASGNIAGTISTVPLPASILLGVFAVGLTGWKLRKSV